MASPRHHTQGEVRPGVQGGDTGGQGLVNQYAVGDLLVTSWKKVALSLLCKGDWDVQEHC